jgi:hypothetical protein
MPDNFTCQGESVATQWVKQEMLTIQTRLGRFTGFSVFFGFIFKPVFSV